MLAENTSVDEMAWGAEIALEIAGNRFWSPFLFAVSNKNNLGQQGSPP